MKKPITERELKDFFEANGGEFVTKEKVKVMARKDWYCIEYLLKENDGDDRYEKYQLYDEVNGAKEFIEGYQLRSIEDLKYLGRSSMWSRYLAEKAELIFTNGDENHVHFRKFRDRTMVFSMNLNYYTEEYKVFNMTDHFKQFVDRNWELIEGMSYKR